MASQCEVIEEQGFFTTTTNPTIIANIVETGIVAGIVSGYRGYVLAETIVGADTLSYVRSDAVFERGRLTDTPTTVGQPFYVVNDSARMSDALFSTRSYTLAETLVGTDTPSFIRYVVIAELGRLIDTAMPVRLFNTLIAETGVLADTLTYARSMRIVETGVLADTLTTQRGAVIAELGTLLVTLLTSGLTSEIIRESGQLLDLVTQFLHARMTVTEEGFVDADPILPGQGQGWTANSDTWGMSRYTNMPFNSIAVIDDVLYGATDAGLFRLEGDSDAGTPIDAGLDTAITDMGSPALKSLGYAYGGFQTDGDMLIQAGSAQGAHQLTYTYQFEHRIDGTGFAPTRAKFGRGIESRYWKFGLRNKNGSYFSMDDLIVLYDLKSRKV